MSAAEGEPAPLRICVVTETYAPEINGVAMTLARLVDGLRARGHAVSVVCPRRRVAPADSLASVRRLDPTRVRGMTMPCYRQARCGLPAGRTLRDGWTRQRPDVVYVATEGPLGWSAL